MADLSDTLTGTRATERWGDLPWRMYDSEVWERHPTFAESEAWSVHTQSAAACGHLRLVSDRLRGLASFWCVGVVCFLHAYSRPAGPVRQHYLLLWCCSLVGGQHFGFHFPEFQQEECRISPNFCILNRNSRQ